MQAKPRRPLGARARVIICLGLLAVALSAAFFLDRLLNSAPSDTPEEPAVTATAAEAETALEPDNLPEYELKSEPEHEAELEPEPEPEPIPAGLGLDSWPVHLRIPVLSADAEIHDTGYDDTETMIIVPSPHIISWLNEGPIPGNAGNAILGGHNRWGGVEGDLLHLDELEIGDEMIIDYADGQSHSFLQESVFVYPLALADADAIMDLEGDPRVTVITCKDPYNPAIGTSDNRIIAVFKEASVFVIPDPPIEPIPLLSPEEAAAHALSH